MSKATKTWLLFISIIKPAQIFIRLIIVIGLGDQNTDAGIWLRCQKAFVFRYRYILFFLRQCKATLAYPLIVSLYGPLMRPKRHTGNISGGAPKLRKGSGFPLILRHKGSAAMASPGYPLQSLTRKTVAGYQLQVTGLFKF